MSSRLVKEDQKTGRTMVAFRSRLASLTYLLSLGNVMIIGIMTIILKYFSTDG